MFGKKFSDCYQYDFGVVSIPGFFKDESKTATLPGSTGKDRPATVKENCALFLELISLLTERKISIKLMLPPLFIDGASIENQGLFEKRRERFCALIKAQLDTLGVHVPIHDFSFTYRNQRLLFRDLEHLNSQGAVEFAKFLNSKFLSD